MYNLLSYIFACEAEVMISTVGNNDESNGRFVRKARVCLFIPKYRMNFVNKCVFSLFFNLCMLLFNSLPKNEIPSHVLTD